MFKNIKNKFFSKLESRSADFKYFIWALKNWRLFKYSPFYKFLLFWILYPIPRLLMGQLKASGISRDIIKIFMNGSLIIPLPINNPNHYYMAFSDIIDFDAFREVCVSDHYNYSQLKPGMVCIDVGAHVGTFTISASLMVGKEGKVIAIEPELHNFNNLIKNLEINKIENVIVKNIALSDYNGKEKFFIDQSTGCHSLFSQKSSVRETEVEVKNLNTLLKELNINKVDMIKIDTEGAEMKILKGAREILLKNPHMKMAIASYHYPEELSEVVRYLKGLNFSPKIISGHYTLVIVP